MTEEGQPLSNEISFDPINILSDAGYNNGVFKIKVNIQRRRIFNISSNIFFIKEISPSRRELRISTTSLTPEGMNDAFTTFINENTSALFYKDFILNFGDNINLIGINLALDVVVPGEEHDLLIKLYEPLPDFLDTNDTFNITEEITNPIEFTIDLGDYIPRGSSGLEIKGPNFKIDTRVNNPLSSNFQSYDNLLNTEISSSFLNLQNALSSSNYANTIYNEIPLVSGSNLNETEKRYHFENFIHFSNATERLKNFEYKLKLIENYDTQVASINTITGDTSQSINILNSKKSFVDKKDNLIRNFDGYERYLYFESGAYAWPKTNSTIPYLQSLTTSVSSKTWLGSEIDTDDYYGGQLLSASFYDNSNPYNLERTLPNHIISSKENNQYKLFVNMIGQYFDETWLFSRNITNIKNTTNIINKGISKDLLYIALQNLGLEVFDQFDSTNLFEYVLGQTTSGSLFYNVQHYVTGSNVASETLVTASNDGSIPKEIITKEVWKRLYHNLPYLLKTKGTERGIKALISCYGIPETILNIKEYSSQIEPLSEPKKFKYDKFKYVLNGESTNTGYFIETPWSSSLTDTLSSSAKTVEFRINPYRSTSQYHLFGLSGSNATLDPHLVLTPSTTDVILSDDKTQFGKLDLYINNTVAASTSNFPIYNGNFWNVFIGTEGTSGSSADIKFGAYQTNFNKNIFHYTASISQTEANRALTFGDPYSSSADNIGGALHAYFGGVPANAAAAYNTVDTLTYSGSLSEVKYYFGELLSHNTLKTHANDPSTYAGNTTSSAYDNLVLYLPLGSNLIKNSSSFHPNRDVSYLGMNDGVSSSMTSQIWKDIKETHYLHYPNSLGSTINSDKIKIDISSSINDNILSPYVRAEESKLKDTTYDLNDLGIFFSPQQEINEDILYNLGNIELDDYIGDPRHQTSSNYKDLTNLQNKYFKKIKKGHKYNIFDYVKLIQHFDYTLFKMIENFVPAKANLKKGLLLEPHILERNKHFSYNPTIREEEVRSGTISGRTINSITGSSIVHGTNFKVVNNKEVITGTNGEIFVSESTHFDSTLEPLYGNYTKSRISKKYYYQVLPYNRYYHQTSISQSAQLS